MSDSITGPADPAGRQAPEQRNPVDPHAAADPHAEPAHRTYPAGPAPSGAGPEREAESGHEPVPPVNALDTGPRPLGVGRTPTGHAEVDERLERLGDADHLPAEGHLEVYEDVHRGLREALTALDARQGPPAPAAPGRAPGQGPVPPSPSLAHNHRS